MRIYLLRHGTAVDHSPDGTDETRALTNEGTEILTRACIHYARHVGSPDRIVSSALVRARQSAEILAATCGYGGEIERSVKLSPGARPTAMLEELQSAALSDMGRVVLVGHEPHLGNLLGLLTTGSEQYSIPLRKGMLVGVQVKELQTMIGKLDLCLRQDDAACLEE